ncbi:hypothetical protein VPHD148_0228 [Vibrio phage D148]
MGNIDFHYEEFVEEIHAKDHEREERMEKSAKARAKRQLIKDKNTRKHDEGYRGNV